jgi:pyruvate-formate lyase-activating enzyme
MKNAKPLYDLRKLRDYDTLMLTGGEPMLYPDRIIKIARILRKVSPSAQIFLYTALHKDDGELERVLKYVDGVQFSLHKEANDKDIEQFQAFQRVANKWKGSKSFRLYVDKAMSHAERVKIIPSVWKRFEIKPWASEDELKAQQPGGLPSGEELFILQKRPDSSIKHNR